MDIQKNITDRIPDALYHTRAKAKLSQEKLADRLGISKNTVRSYEAGSSTPTLAMSMEWCAACGRDINDYLGEVFAFAGADSPSMERAKLQLYISNAPEEELARLHALVFCRHGGRWSALLSMALAHIHLPMRSRCMVAQQLAWAYEMEQAAGQDPCPELMQPDLAELHSAIDDGAHAVQIGKNDYTGG